ncbi:hypothetical protein ACWQXT_25175 [Citrobacter werkmanii]|uniref:hypothetical protein n=1 Tax=Citrobacter TaxID=544 RepID=UPI00136F13E6|nr:MULTISPECIES: hypothetical protein [Citrobacter]MYL93782.1 hypothetical protein [Citrobacter werkmanii]
MITKQLVETIKHNGILASAGELKKLFTKAVEAEEKNIELEKKLTDLAVQLANTESKCRELSSKAMELVCEASLVYSKYNDTQMPDRDLVDMQTLQEMHDLCKGAVL